MFFFVFELSKRTRTHHKQIITNLMFTIHVLNLANFKIWDIYFSLFLLPGLIPCVLQPSRRQISIKIISSTQIHYIFFSLSLGLIPCVLHPPRRQRPRTPSHRQHLHESTQTSGVQRQSFDAAKTLIRCGIRGRIWAQLKWGFELG